MNLEKFHPDPITDCHIHYPHPSQMPGLIQTCDELQDRPSQHRLHPASRSA